MRKLQIQPLAREDLFGIWDYIAKDNLTAANRAADELDAAIRGLARMPGKGHARSDVRNPKYRFWTVYSYVIGFEYDDKTVTIVRVIHGRRDLRRIFK